MNREQAKKSIPLLQAYADGVEFQFRAEPHQEWQDLGNNLNADRLGTHPERYRIKPEPRVFYGIVWPSGAHSMFADESVRDGYLRQEPRAEGIKVIEQL